MKYKLSVWLNWFVGAVPTVLALGFVSSESAAGKALLALSTLAGLAYGALRTSAENDKAAAAAAQAGKLAAMHEASLSLRGGGTVPSGNVPSTR